MSKIEPEVIQDSSEALLVATDPMFPEVKGELIDGFPEGFPVYPGAILIASSKTNPDGLPDSGYRARWDILDGSTTTEVLAWYKKELTAAGWDFTDPDDPEGVGELIAKLNHNKKELYGYVAAEIMGESLVELVVNLKKD